MQDDNKPQKSAVHFPPIDLSAPKDARPVTQGTGFLVGEDKIKFMAAMSHEEVAKRTRRVYMAPYLTYNTAGDLYGAMRGVGDVAIIGAGPSLVDNLDQIREWQKPENGVILLTLNNAHNFLLEHGIKPDIAVIIESREHAAAYIDPVDDVSYLVGSSVHDATLRKFFGVSHNTHIWHPIQDDEHRAQIAALNKTFTRRKIPGVSGGTSVMIRMMDFLVAFMGARRLRFIGCDSSARDREMHALKKAHSEPLITAQIQDRKGNQLRRKYTTTHSMYRQAGEFWMFVDARAKEVRAGTLNAFEIMFYGRGLLPDWAALHNFHVDSVAIKKELEDEGFEQKVLFNDTVDLSTEIILTAITFGGAADTTGIGRPDGHPAADDQRVGEQGADAAS